MKSRQKLSAATPLSATALHMILQGIQSGINPFAFGHTWNLNQNVHLQKQNMTFQFAHAHASVQDIHAMWALVVLLVVNQEQARDVSREEH